MPRLEWDKSGKRFYETGVDHCVLYPKTGTGGAYAAGVVWNGITAISESPSGAEPTALYADNIKYLNLMSTEEFGFSIEAYTYPDEFAVCDGSVALTTGVVIGQQPRKLFGLCYRTAIGNDDDGSDHGYKLHIVYGCLASPSEKGYSTINDSPEAITFSWEVATTPVAFTDEDYAAYKPVSHIVIDSTKADADKLAALEDILYGTDGSGSSTGTTASLPDPDDVLDALKTP